MATLTFAPVAQLFQPGPEQVVASRAVASLQLRLRRLALAVALRRPVLRCVLRRQGSVGMSPEQILAASRRRLLPEAPSEARLVKEVEDPRRQDRVGCESPVLCGAGVLTCGACERAR